MSSYLLLRSNKQSGPLSQEQLLQLGLKPYDLVWIEGKSAAWRYPSEIPELKDYAPVVEEQPYDRFYKKQTEEPKEQELVVARVANVYEKQKEVKEEKYEQYTPVKTVFAIKQGIELKEQEPLVAQVADVYEKPKETKEIAQVREMHEVRETREEKYEQYMPKKAVSVIMPKQAAPQKREEPVFIPAPVSPVVRAIAERPDVETKYSQPLDDIKEMYVKQLQQRKHKTAQKKFVIQSLKKVAVFIAIIGSGVLIGFMIKPKHASKNIAVSPSVQKISPVNTNESANEETIQADLNNKNATSIKESKQQPVNNKNEVVANEPKSLPTATENNIVEKKNEEKDESLNQSVPETINTQSGERNKTSRNNIPANEANEKNIVAREEVSKLVSVRSNDYKLGAFGGFHNLELTVTNNSKYALDNVMVELQYLKLSDQPIKIEHIRFQSIGPGASLSMRVPDTKRGAKLLYKIIKVEPKDLNTTAGL
jgi:hypothetical protein